MKRKNKKIVSGPISFKMKHASLVMFISLLIIVASLSLMYLSGRDSYNYYYENYHSLSTRDNNKEVESTTSSLSKMDFSSMTLNECNSLEGFSGKMCKASVLLRDSKEKDDVSVCDMDSEVSEICKDNYYISKALKNQDADYCKKVSSSERDVCYLNLKVETNDKSYCNYIESSFMKKLCISE